MFTRVNHTIFHHFGYDAHSLLTNQKGNLIQYQLERIITAFAEYYNQHRAHQGIEQKLPAKLNQPGLKLSNQVKDQVIATPMLNGLHQSYAYAAC